MNKVRIETGEHGEASVVSLNGLALENVVSVSQAFEIDGYMYVTLVLQAEPIELIRQPDQAAVAMQKELNDRAVVEAYEYGKIVQWRPKGSEEWYVTRRQVWPHNFDFDANEYRLVKR